MSPRLQVIGLCGVARSGKDTAAKLLDAHFGAMRVALADGIRSSIRDLDGMAWEVSKTNDRGFRFPLTRLGNEAREDLSGQESSCRHWLSHALIKMRYLSFYHPAPCYRFVIPDIRMIHESPVLKCQIAAWGGEYRLIKIKRSSAGLSGDDANHKTENQIDGIVPDHLIYNNGSIDDLYLSLCEVVFPSWL